MTIEDIILTRDRRGVAKLREKLPTNYCEEAARFILDSRGPAMIISGFYTAPGYETDGPVGALVLGRALERVGYRVHHVTDGCTEMLRDLMGGPGEKVINFPVSDHDSSKKLAGEILSDLRPAVAVAVERCAFNRDLRYINMHGGDITEHTAKLDYLFLGVERTVGIGDGGNEIGMGLLYDSIPQVSTLAKDPATTPATHLVIASVSNWGAYGLVGYISIHTGQDLLPTVEEERKMVERWVDMGGVDGFSGEKTYSVDGLSLDENSAVMAELRREVATGLR
ncbi:MAG: glutamate cyclase domain-containing protein [Dehalococcoidia bacterium]